MFIVAGESETAQPSNKAGGSLFAVEAGVDGVGTSASSSVLSMMQQPTGITADISSHDSSLPMIFAADLFLSPDPLMVAGPLLNPQSEAEHIVTPIPGVAEQNKVSLEEQSRLQL
ncbi:hypothetical protein CTheo_8561 [Ceratobasidium theobromae]|uniref:Uncharacterized protein n=1 Tax=Ceratobasidium theobromae TaxID=1582974 RepID=A0A5N5Q8N0_9AGAM|nr:hypothetical protein CTheo_8561 [Ceratobasidium theobromae]